MQIDKQNGMCKYNDENHCYFNDSGEKFISVTTLISKYHEKFDEMFWAKYKAFEKLADSSAFSMEKKALLATKIFKDSILDTYNIDELKFNTQVNEILDGYEEKRRTACERGTKWHAEREQEFYTAEYQKLDRFNLGGEFRCIKDNYDLSDEKGVYPEYLIYRVSDDGKLKVAGQIDLLIKDGNEITIVDWKTNAKIDQKSFYNQSKKSYSMMYYPVNTLQDCNFNHYQLQLSTYAWMVSKLNPEFVVKDLILVHCDHDDNITEYKCQYLKPEVERMLAHYRKQMELDEKKSKLKKIDFN